MKKKYSQFFLFVMCIIGHAVAVPAQQAYKINNAKENNMKLSGTSTLHKWTMNATAFTGDAQFEFAPGNGNELGRIASLSFILPVLNLKSDDKKLNKNAYKALKTDQHRNILYTLTSAQVLPGKAHLYQVKTHGRLSIAGVTKEIAMDVYCLVGKDGTITCNGSKKLKMTDYNVKPPTFMMGAMSTGDNITLDFRLAYKK